MLVTFGPRVAFTTTSVIVALAALPILRAPEVKVTAHVLEQRAGRDPPASLWAPEVGKLAELLGRGEHVAVVGIVAQLGKRNITQQRLPIYLDRLAGALCTCKGRCWRNPDLCGVDAAEADR